jgi:hypothetical protein
VKVGLRDTFDSVKKELDNVFAGDFKVGELFEDYVDELFPDTHFSCVKAPNRFDKKGKKRRVEQNLEPDFKFRDRKSDHQFWVEAKWRQELYQDKLHWCKPYQFKRYKEFRERVRPEKVFIVAGLDELPSHPKFLFVMDLDKEDYPALYESKLKEFERDTKKPFNYQSGRLY